MKKLLLALVILALMVAPVLAGSPGPKGYKGTWRKVLGKVVVEADIKFHDPAPGVEDLQMQVPDFATRYTYFVDGNYYCAYNDGWTFYVCGPNDGSGYFCKYYADRSIECK